MKTQTMNWNGLTLQISAEPNKFLSRIEGEEITSLKVTTPAKILINDTYAASIISQAGGTANFVDVMLSAELAA